MCCASAAAEMQSCYHGNIDYILGSSQSPRQAMLPHAEL